MGTNVDRIRRKIHDFQRKYYVNVGIRGAILSVSVLLAYYLLATVVEHNLWMAPWARFLIFASFFIVVGICAFLFLRQPIRWWITKKGLTEEQSAQLIGGRIPTVRDRLLNFVQLTGTSQSPLAAASINQKAVEFDLMEFDQVISLAENRKYLRFLAVPFFLLIAILLFNSAILTEGTKRLVLFNQEFSPKSPFTFEVDPVSLEAFYNEDFTLTFGITGNLLPEDVYLNTESQRVKIDQHDGRYSYTFEKIQTPFSFQIEAAGFYSERYSVSLNNRPEINNLSIQLEYPKYLSKKNEMLTNSGNLLIPEGTVVQWTLSTAFTDRATIIFTSDSLENAMQLVDNQSVIFKRAMRSSDSYVINLSNASGSNQDKIQYHIEIVKDLFPSITVNNLKDSVLYQRIMLGGIIGDDYGLTRLTLNYSIHNDELGTDRSGSISLDVSNLLQQSFYYNWSLDSLKLKADEKLEYYLEVWDNDGVNGRKSSRSARYIFNVPSTQDLIGEIKKSERQSEQHLQESRQKSNKLQEQIEDANQKLKGKQNLNWQDKKMLEDILREKERLQESIDQLKEENSLLNQKKELFTEQDERIKQKAEQIQKLMNELLDEETKKLFEELQRMLKENTDVNDMQKLMNKLNNNTQNLEKELERTLSLFKELQFDFKLDQSIKSLEEHIEQQKDLLDKTEKLENDKIQNEEERKHKSESLAKEQEELKNEVNETGKEIEELENLSEELHNETGLDENENTDSIEQDQENSEEQLNENQPGKAKSPQKKSIEKMKQMAQKMQAAQSSMEMEMSEANLESLRQIVHGLVKLSYDEEQLLREFGELSQIDPRFNVIAQRQLKVKDDIKVIEDSLMALGSRDPFMGSVITKKVGELNNHLDNVVEANKERRRPQASSEMQATMASINDLALILDNHYEMMMQMMAKGGAGKPKKGSKKGPKLSEMQQQLNEKIKELKGSGKSGRQLSEELAEMAAEQERIRKALQEMEKKMKDGKLPGDLDGKMEQTETDLVNKQLTDQLIKRQQEILTRLLDSEKSMREQDMEEERKGETAKDYQKEIPKAFEDYLRLKEKEVELLKTVPPKLYPYYKKEVGEYFKRMAKP